MSDEPSNFSEAEQRITAGVLWRAVLSLGVFLLLLSLLAIFPVAALDDGRYHWSSVPLWLVVFGYLLFSIGFVVSAWVEAVNKFAEPGVRIQTERGHKVVDTGPCAIVRHPLYLAAFFLFSGFALALGSFWALVPAAVAVLKRPVKQLLFWSPRVLTILFAGFLSLFALDVFGEGYGFWGTVVALFMHLIPTWIVLVVLGISWRWEWVGAFLFVALGLFYAYVALGRGHLDWVLVISGPLFLVGGLFLVHPTEGYADASRCSDAASPRDFSRHGSGVQWREKKDGPQSRWRPGA